MGCTDGLQKINKPTNLLNIDVVWMHYMFSQVSQRIDVLTFTTGS